MKVIYEFDTNSENFDPAQLKIFQQSQEMAYTIREIPNKFVVGKNIDY